MNPETDLSGDIKIQDTYRKLSTLLKDPKVLQFNPLNIPFKKTESVTTPWIETDGIPKSVVNYNANAYLYRFGKNYDPFQITTHVLHELAHWYYLDDEDGSWAFAYTVIKAYQSKCAKFVACSIQSLDTACKSYQLVRSAAIHHGVRTFQPKPRPQEPLENGVMCVDAYSFSVQKLIAQISTEEEMGDLDAAIVNGEKLPFMAESSFDSGVGLGLVSTFLEVMGGGMIASIMAQPALWPADAAAIAAGGGAIGIVGSVTGNVGDEVDEQKASAADEVAQWNGFVQGYNDEIDDVINDMNQHRQGPKDRLVFHDRQFAYAILSEARIGKSDTLRLALAKFNPVVSSDAFSQSHLKFKFNVNEIVRRLKLVAESRSLCNKSLPTSADLGKIISKN